MLFPHGTIVAVTDGHRLHLYRNGGNEQSLELAAMDDPKLHHEGGPSAGHHVSSANPEKGAHGEDEYVRAVADYLNKQVLGHKIEHLYVIAAPRALGELRKHYHKMTEKALVGELSKELTGASLQDIEKALHAVK